MTRDTKILIGIAVIAGVFLVVLHSLAHSIIEMETTEPIISISHTEEIFPHHEYKYGCPECRSVQWTSTRLLGVHMGCNACFTAGRKLWTTVYLGQHHRQEEE